MAPARVAIIGGGVAGTACAYALREEVLAGRIKLSLFEPGRGPGGRAATRKTREHPGLILNHGASSFTARSHNFTELCGALTQSGALKPLQPSAGARLRADGAFEPEDAAAPRFAGGRGAIADLSEALLRGGSLDGPNLAEAHFGTMVRGIEPLAAGWRLMGTGGVPLGDFDWLLVSSATVGHPRWRQTFGGEPPLCAASAALGETQLEAALTALARVQSQPVVSCLMSFEADAATAWARLPCAAGGAGGHFAGCEVEGDETIARLLVQPLAGGLTSVVVHSTHGFACEALDVYGATSTAARVGGAATDSAREQQVLDKLLTALRARLVPRWLRPEHLAAASACWGPHLHRWGAAFPKAPHLLDEALAVCPRARVAFCGDFVAGPHAGSVEGAVMAALTSARRSAEELAALPGGYSDAQ